MKINITILALVHLAIADDSIEVVKHLDSWTYFTSDEITLRCQDLKCQDYDWSSSKWIPIPFSQLSPDLQDIIRDAQ